MRIFVENNPLDRAKSVLQLKNDYELAEFFGVTHSTVGGYRKRGNTLPLAQAIKVIEHASITLDWLILGKGEPDGGGYPAADLGIVPIALYDVSVSAGSGSFFERENIIQYIPFDVAWTKKEGLRGKDLACLSIKGDSMMPGLIDGDIVLVNRAITRGDGIFVLRIGQALRIKRLQWLADGTLRISSDNPIYQPEYIDPAKATDDFAIIGACHTKIGRVS